MKKIKKTNLIKSNNNCIGCNKCIRNCGTVQGLIAKRTTDGKNRITVDPNKCIACGSCFRVCEHNALEYKDDTKEFFKALKSGEKISLLVAPSFFGNYADKYKEILGGLKKLGACEIINVGLGADITTWGYINYFEKNNIKGGISQPCPTVVSYIEHYVPSLISKLVPVQSPMMCAAIYAKNEKKIKDKLAFIGPCISKKEEQMSKRGKGMISYNVTFKNLLDYMSRNKLFSSDFEIEIEHGLGSIYPITGGLKESINWFCGDGTYIRHIDGSKNVYKFLNEYKKLLGSDENPYLLIDALNCKNGCSFGPGNDNDEIRKEKSIFELMKIKQDVTSSKETVWNQEVLPWERLRLLNERFGNLKLEDYLCEYTDLSSEIEMKIPTKTELDYIFHTMNKDTKEDMEIQCSCCGYDTCTDMAIAIHNGMNVKENCAFYMKDEITRERDKARKAEIFVELAKKDLHTGLLNRNAYYAWFEDRTDFRNCGCIMFDLNDLKKCNDTYGHEAGDEYIKSAASIINFVYSKVGKIFRIGGDEFCVIIEDAASLNIDVFTQRFDTLVDDHNANGSLMNTLKLAYGFAIFDSNLDSDFSDTLKRADKKMYEHKSVIKGLHSNK